MARLPVLPRWRRPQPAEAGTPGVTSHSGLIAGRRSRVWRPAKAGSGGKHRSERAGSRRRHRGLGQGAPPAVPTLSSRLRHLYALEKPSDSKSQYFKGVASRRRLSAAPGWLFSAHVARCLPTQPGTWSRPLRPQPTWAGERGCAGPGRLRNRRVALVDWACGPASRSVPGSPATGRRPRHR